jgi:predicted enzyme related to lactoylglutathione lyase
MSDQDCSMTQEQIDAHAAMVGKLFCWHELVTRDTAAAKKFFCDLMGWTTSEQDMGPMGTYTMFEQDGLAVGGMMGMDHPDWEGVPPHWMTYLQVDDVDAKAAKVTELGGTICVPPTDIPNVGRFCVINDPSGGTISLFKSAKG